MALAKDNQGNLAQVIQPGDSQVVAYTATAAQSAAIPGDRARILRLWASTDAYFKLGTNPTADALAGSHPITAKVDTYIACPAGYKISVVRQSGDGSLYISYDA